MIDICMAYSLCRVTTGLGYVAKQTLLKPWLVKEEL